MSIQHFGLIRSYFSLTFAAPTYTLITSCGEELNGEDSRLIEEEEGGGGEGEGEIEGK